MHSRIWLLYRKYYAHLCETEFMSRFYVYPNISMELCSESETIQPNELPYPAVINFRVHVLHFFFWYCRTYVAYRTSLSLCLSNIWCMEVIETSTAGLLLDQDSGRTHYLVQCKCNHWSYTVRVISESYYH